MNFGFLIKEDLIYMVSILDFTGLNVCNTSIRIQNFGSSTFYILIHKLFIYGYLLLSCMNYYLYEFLVILVLHKKHLLQTKSFEYFQFISLFFLHIHHITWRVHEIQ